MGRRATGRPRARPTPAKLKSVTFTGCWTCRSRKVKCDERQKNGCGVCERVGLSCAGYGVKLYWVTGQKEDIQVQQRRMIKPEVPLGPILSDDELTRVLAAIDASPPQWDTFAKGPFAIFQANNAGPATEISKGPLSVSGLDDMSTSGPHIEQCDTMPKTQARVLESPRLDFDTAVLTLEDLLRARESQDQEFFGEDDVQAMERAIYSTTEQPLDLDLSTSSRPDLDCASALDFGLSMPLFRNRQTSMLMHHYMNHVAELLQPVLHPQNPWRTTYFPFALDGCPDLFLYQTSTLSSSHASTALFHSLLSAAAFHLRNVTHGSAEFHQLGLQHRIKALRAMKAAPIYPSDVQPAIVYLTAILSLVTIDTMTGEDSDFPIHLNGCRELRKPLRHAAMLGDSWHQVNSICRFLTLLARTTVHTVKPRMWKADSLVCDPPHFRSDERCIEYIYGVTPALGNFLFRTCQISEYLAYYHSRGEHVPESLQEACQRLGESIITWNIESEPFHLIEAQEMATLEIVRCQARAFYKAVLVFYYRTTQNGGATFFPAIDLESEIQSIWENLALAEDLKDVCMGGAKRAAPMSWPAFIAACEATNRWRWVEWWERVQGYHVGNLTRQWKIIQEIWSVADADDTITDWRDALRRTGKLILPI